MSLDRFERVPCGLNDYAQLRLRDHRPGNGNYQLPPSIGPGSGSPQKSILRKYPDTDHSRNAVGPGQYNLPDLTGTGRKARFVPDLVRDSNGNTVFPSREKTPEKDSSKRKISMHPLAKQYSMALCPSTPQYSLYSRFSSDLAKDSTGPIGPGEYQIASEFQPSNWGVPKGASFGLKLDLYHDQGFPGPGTYNTEGIGDALPFPKEYNPMPPKKRTAYATPGPGTYEDPTTISNRIPTRTKLWQRCTFGGKDDHRRERRAGPGPAGYNIANMNQFLERKQRHAPTFHRSCRVPRRPQGKRDSAEKTFPNVTIPSDFDYDYKKGKSMLPRWHDKPPEKNEAGPGNFSTDVLFAPPHGGRFAAAPFNPYAMLQSREKEREKPSAGNFYYPSYKFVEKRTRGGLINPSRSNGGAPSHPIPGPGHYHYTDDATNSSGRATLFYKGDFHDRGGGSGGFGPGPGAHYNDESEYSASIQGSKRFGKSFGIRFPARATYQHCKQVDETTNINCIYPDEQTWECPPIVP